MVLVVCSGSSNSSSSSSNSGRRLVMDAPNGSLFKAAHYPLLAVKAADKPNGLVGRKGPQ